MNLSVEINTDEFNDAVRRYIKDVRVGVPEGLRKQSRLLFGRILANTYPQTRAQGRRAVARDIENAVRPLIPTAFSSIEIRRLIRKRDYAGLQRIFGRSHDPDYRRAKVVPFSPELHQKARDRRGRVQRWTGMVTPDRDAVRDYIKSQQDHVGRGKGGWAAAFMAAGGRPASWVARWASTGEVDDRLTDPVVAYIKAENRSEWAAHGDDDRIVASALKSRTKDILTDIELRLAQAAGEAAKQA